MISTSLSHTCPTYTPPTIAEQEQLLNDWLVDNGVDRTVLNTQEQAALRKLLCDVHAANHTLSVYLPEARIKKDEQWGNPISANLAYWLQPTGLTQIATEERLTEIATEAVHKRGQAQQIMQHILGDALRRYPEKQDGDDHSPF